MQDISGTALLYSGGLLDDIHAKTAHGLLRYSDRFQILGLIDPKFYGSMSADHVEHCKDNLEIYKDLSTALEELTQKPKYLVMGVAFGGGMLPDEHRSVVKDALRHGMDVVCGLHELLSEDPELAELAVKNDVNIHDIRKPKKAEELRFWNGDIKKIEIPKVAVLGTDCATGKRTTCQFLVQALKESGIKIITCSCAECYRTFAVDYDLPGTLGIKVEHITQTLQGRGLKFKAPEDVTVAYHDPCRLGRMMGDYEAPRDLIQLVDGATMVELENNKERALCCGVSSMMYCNDATKAVRRKRLDQGTDAGKGSP